MESIRASLVKLENKRRFLDWFVWDRFYESLTEDERRTFASAGELPNPIPDRPNKLVPLDLKSLLKRWEDEERMFGGRSPEELECYAKNGFWPEQRGRFHYSTEDGRMFADWRLYPEENDAQAAGTEYETRDCVHKGCKGTQTYRSKASPPGSQAGVGNPQTGAIAWGQGERQPGWNCDKERDH